MATNELTAEEKALVYLAACDCLRYDAARDEKSQIKRSALREFFIDVFDEDSWDEAMHEAMKVESMEQQDAANEAAERAHPIG